MVSIAILAAGLGTRMYSKTPKVLHALSGLCMLEHIIQACLSLRERFKDSSIYDGFKIYVIASEVLSLHKEFQSLVAKYNLKVGIQVEQLGTANAIGVIREEVHSKDIMILPGDMPLITADILYDMIGFHFSSDAILTVLGFKANNPTGYGRIICDSENNLAKIIEEKDATSFERKIDLCNAGVYFGDTKAIFNALSMITNNNAAGEYYLTDVIEVLHNDNKNVKAFISYDEAQTLGVNNRLQLHYADLAMQKRLKEKLMQNGVTLLMPESIYIAADAIIEQDVTIEPHVVIMKGVHIKSGSVIKASSYLEGALIGHDCNIGPFARLRPGTVIKDAAFVGNFVEMKNVEFGRKSKASHLSYIGDATIGERVNIGAGAIFCNYDGRNKHHTKIGEGAFIGSNTAIVAPCDIGKNALIAAGSVITETVEDAQLAIARSRQINKDR